MMQRELVQFRTPQHSSSGTNHWGGASPLLARNIPKESLEQRYLRLNTIRTRDEIFPAEDDEFNNLSQTLKSKLESAPKPRSLSRGLLSMLIFPRNKEKAVATLGSNSKKKRWFPRWDPHNRWPQGHVYCKSWAGNDSVVACS
ncbi:hypothetical protein WN944_016719 [Citrus x changshan-huyou]|uniref:Uncharacterized protein n=2 Tax=Citrus TaxID=2706 RepID=A0ACB8MIS3_CITSI|nr:hypothetical protein KPL71_009969 [Citrus sinensis]